MFAELLRTPAGFGILGLGLAGVLLAIWAIRALGRAPRRDRTDRATAIRLAGVLAVTGLAVVAGFFTLFAMGWGGSIGGALSAGLGLGGVLALAIFLSSLVGYALLARPRIGSIALIGVIAGPLVLGGAAKLAVDVQTASAADANRMHLQTVWQASLDAQVHLEVRDVQATIVQVRDSNEQLIDVVERVRLTVVVDVARELGFYVDQTPVVWLFPSGAPEARLEGTLPVDLLYLFPPGKEAFTVDAVAPSDATIAQRDARVAGTWTLRVIMLPGIPLPITSETDLEITADPVR